MNGIIFPASGHDLDVFARTIFGEARGESLEGQIAVAWVIRHRAQIAANHVASTGNRHPLYGNGSIAAACQQKWQFSCWLPSDPTYRRMADVTLDDPAFQRAHMVATKVLHGEAEDRLPGTTHYYAISIAPPAWTKGATLAGAIGHHRFYRNVK